VLDPGGAPVAAAEVAVFHSDPAVIGAAIAQATWTTTDATGHFRLALPPGAYALSAQHPDLGTGNLECIQVDRGNRRILPAPVILQPGTCRVEGRVAGPKGPAAELRVLLHPVGPEARLRLDRIVLARASGDRFRLNLQAGRYWLVIQAPGCQDHQAWLEATGPALALDLKLLPQAAPASRPVHAFIRQNGVALATCEPGGDVADLERLAGLFGSARVIGLGEACHGTHQLFRLKQRIIEWLPEVTTLALEMNLADGFRVADYLAGTGPDPWNELQAGFQSREFRELLERLRAQRNDPRSPRRIAIHGMDSDSAGPPYRWALSHLRRTDSSRADFLEARLRDLEPLSLVAGPVPTPARILEWQSALRELRSRSRSGAASLDEARYHRCLFVLEQLLTMLPDRMNGLMARERLMADNLRWILDQEGGRGKVLIWAHDGHVTWSPRGRSGYPAMGWFLKEALGPDYLAIGLGFGQGRFAGSSDGQPGVFRVGLHQAGTLTRALASAGQPILALDLRTVPGSGPVADWFRGPQGCWSIAAQFDPRAPREAIQEEPVTEAFDGLLFVAECTPLSFGPI
jgi:erythromycin esterase